MLFYRRVFLFNSGCRRTTSGSPLPTDCNACLFFKRVDNGECVEKCPEGFKPTDNTCVPSESICIIYSSNKARLSPNSRSHTSLQIHLANFSLTLKHIIQ